MLPVEMCTCAGSCDCNSLFLFSVLIEKERFILVGVGDEVYDLLNLLWKK